MLGRERIHQGVSDTVSVSEVTVVAVWTTVVAVQTTPPMRVGTTEPDAFRVSAAGGGIWTGVVVVAVDDGALCLLGDAVAFGVLKGNDRQNGAAGLHRSLLPRHGNAQPRLVGFVAPLGCQVATETRGAAVGLIRAAHGLWIRTAAISKTGQAASGQIGADIPIRTFDVTQSNTQHQDPH